MATLTEIITLCKSETDNVNSTFITDSEWTSWINNSYRELYGLITQAFGNDYFVQTPSTGYTFTTDGANSFFSLPADFFKLLGVDLLVSSPGVYVSLKPFDFVDRNRFGQFNS